jgi:hypothetical protein
MTTHATDHIQHLLGSSALLDTTWAELTLFETELLPLINQQWDLVTQFEQGMSWYTLNPSPTSPQYPQHQANLQAVIANLGARPNPEHWSRAATTFFLNPQLWQPRYETGHWNRIERMQSVLLQQVARIMATEHPPTDWQQRLAQRILMLLTSSALNMYQSPSISECLNYLLVGANDVSDQPALTRFATALATGDLSTAWNALQTLADQQVTLDSTALKTYVVEHGENQILLLLEVLYRQNTLTAPYFRQLIELIPESLAQINSALTRSEVTERVAGLYAAIQPLLDAVLWEMVCDMRPESWPVLTKMGALQGGQYLVRLLEEIEWRGLTKLTNAHSGEISLVVCRLLHQLQWRTADDHASLVRVLRQFKPETILAALPHATAYERPLLATLQWPGSAEFVALLQRLSHKPLARSTDPTVGVVARQEILATLDVLAVEQRLLLIQALQSTYSEAITLVQAALGENRKELRQKLGRRNQLAARALGLLPCDTPAELLQRYLLLTRYYREANSSSAGKKSYEWAAARAGLANLALNTGYTDVTRLEWAMEDQLGAQCVTLGREWQIEEYTLTLTLRGFDPILTIRNSKRQLKRTPTAVTRDYAYREVKATLEQAQDQTRRYRDAFIEAMRTGQPLSQEEIALLRRNPLAVALLESLVLIDSNGAIGLFRAEDLTVEGVRGERVPLSGTVTIAHPYTLAKAGLLNNWQTELVRRQLTQPFKQIFREVYMITPAELDSAYSSARVAGRQMRGRQAIAVLANLGWQIDGYGSVRKAFYQLGFAAQFEAGTAYDYYDYEDNDHHATTGGLSFWPVTTDASCHEERRLPLANIPPLIFSEVLRDLDLVTVIAHQGAEEGASREVLQRRADLVRAFSKALGMSQVTVEEPFVWVNGSRSRYRIHLTTGAIYLANGQYLCIVPSSKERKTLYLPFEAGGEPIVSEIISKVLLLANDAQINDPTIIQQIPQTAQTAHAA